MINRVNKFIPPYMAALVNQVFLLFFLINTRVKLILIITLKKNMLYEIKLAIVLAISNLGFFMLGLLWNKFRTPY